MFRILRYSLIFLIAVSMANFRVFTRAMSTVSKSFIAYRIAPYDVIPVPPDAFATVKYSSGAVVCLGNVISPSKAQDIPQVNWNACPDKFYTVAMVDPDAPSPIFPIYRLFQHWLVGNVPGNNIAAGETLSAYVGPIPPQGTGLHRYVILVNEQPGKLKFDEPRLSNTSMDERRGFCFNKFATKYGLGTPVAGNFYRAKFDNYVLVARRPSKSIPTGFSKTKHD